MAVRNASSKAFTAGEDLEPNRRVKLSSSSGTEVEYADQSDSDSYVGFTLTAADEGDSVTVLTTWGQATFKAVAADTFSVGSTLYAADDGKVSDSSSGNAIGTALEAATAAGDVVEILADLGSNTSGLGPESINNYAAADGGAIPFVVSADVSGAETVTIWDGAAPRNCKVIDAWSINTGAGGGTWKVTDGTNDIISQVTTAASDTDIDRAADVDDAYNEIAADGTLAVVSTGATMAATVYITLIPVAAS
jgi:hypothetical protein